jgi:hypothetical protein
MGNLDVHASTKPEVYAQNVSCVRAPVISTLAATFMQAATLIVDCFT